MDQHETNGYKETDDELNELIQSLETLQSLTVLPLLAEIVEGIPCRKYVMSMVENLAKIRSGMLI